MSNDVRLVTFIAGLEKLCGEFLDNEPEPPVDQLKKEQPVSLREMLLEIRELLKERKEDYRSPWVWRGPRAWFGINESSPPKIGGNESAPYMTATWRPSDY